VHLQLRSRGTKFSNGAIKIFLSPRYGGDFFCLLAILQLAILPILQKIHLPAKMDLWKKSHTAGLAAIARFLTFPGTFFAITI
jgi:hypothetical protein